MLNEEQKQVVNQFIDALEVIRQHPETRFKRTESDFNLKASGRIDTKSYHEAYLKLVEARDALREVLSTDGCGLPALDIISNHPRYVVGVCGKKIDVTFSVPHAGSHLPVEFRIAGYDS